jgi:hypothetical protein
VARLNNLVCTTASLLLFTALPAPRATAQNGIAPPGQNDNQQTTESIHGKDRIRTHVNEVIVPVTVTDKKGDLVLDLVQTEFHIFDKGAEQSIRQFDIDADPLAVALVVDTNARLRAMTPVIQGMGSIFT